MPEYLVSYQCWPLNKPKEWQPDWNVFQAENDDDARDTIKIKFRERGPNHIVPMTFKVLNVWEIRRVSLD